MAKNDTGAFSNELLDQLLAGRDPKSVLDSGGLIGLTFHVMVRI